MLTFFNEFNATLLISLAVTFAPFEAEKTEIIPLPQPNSKTLFFFNSKVAMYSKNTLVLIVFLEKKHSAPQ